MDQSVKAKTRNIKDGAINLVKLASEVENRYHSPTLAVRIAGTGANFAGGIANFTVAAIDPLYTTVDLAATLVFKNGLLVNPTNVQKINSTTVRITLAGTVNGDVIDAVVILRKA